MSLETATAKDGLVLKKCTCHVKQIARRISEKKDMEALLRENMAGDALVVLWLMQGIVWGKWKDGTLSLHPDENVAPEEAGIPGYWQELRVFNEDEELHLRRCDDAFTGRYRRDEDQDGPNAYVDSFSRFWGEKQSAADGYVTLVDSSRKLRLVIPAEGNARWYGLQTRNYVGSDEATGLSGYIDYRFVHIASAEEGK